MKTEISGKVALVTGANRGIGKAIVEALIRHGAKKVYLAVRRPESAASLVAEFGSRVKPLQADISERESLTELAKQASDVSIVINNAGVLEVASVLDAHAQQALSKELDVNVFGLIRMAQAFVPVLERNGGGAFVQLNSVASIKAFHELATYCASKAASYSITQSLKNSVAAKNIQVLSVHPGPIVTDMAVQAGMADMGEPPEVVGEGIVAALKAGDFHLFPDTMAQDFGAAYHSYAQAIIEADVAEGAKVAEMAEA